MLESAGSESLSFWISFSLDSLSSVSAVKGPNEVSLQWMMHWSVLEEESATLSSLLPFLDVIFIQDTSHFTVKQ